MKKDREAQRFKEKQDIREKMIEKQAYKSVTSSQLPRRESGNCEEGF